MDIFDALIILGFFGIMGLMSFGLLWSFNWVVNKLFDTGIMSERTYCKIRNMLSDNQDYLYRR